MRGRKPKPTKLRILTGNAGKRPLNPSEPRPRRGIPTCPAHLDAEAKREWRRVSRELDGMGVLTKVDRAALAAYCAAWSRWVHAELQLRRIGPVYLIPGTQKMATNPYSYIVNQALRQMHAFLSEFGMSPASRTRLHVAPPPGDADPFAEFTQTG
jgi:P27 family predicted phage terminase small subunit